jgi:hypothetical protein
MRGHTRIFHHETQYTHVEAGQIAPQRTHLSQVNKAAVFFHAAQKLLLQIPTFQNSLIHKTNTNHHKINSQFLTITSSRTTPRPLPLVEHGHQHNMLSETG